MELPRGAAELSSDVEERERRNPEQKQKQGSQGGRKQAWGPDSVARASSIWYGKERLGRQEEARPQRALWASGRVYARSVTVRFVCFEGSC